jgi:flagellar M-ring protein FliF
MLARNLSALLIAALIVFGIGKPLLKRRAAAPTAAPARSSRKASIGNEIAAVLAHEVRHDPNRPVTLDMIEAAPGYANRAALIRNFVRQDPARAALVVRDLIRSDMPGGEERDG